MATCAADGVKLWDLRKLRNFKSLAPYEEGTPTAAVAFDHSGLYLGVGGAGACPRCRCPRCRLLPPPAPGFCRPASKAALQPPWPLLAAPAVALSGPAAPAASSFTRWFFPPRFAACPPPADARIYGVKQDWGVVKEFADVPKKVGCCGAGVLGWGWRCAEGAGGSVWESSAAGVWRGVRPCGGLLGVQAAAQPGLLLLRSSAPHFECRPGLAARRPAAAGRARAAVWRRRPQPAGGRCRPQPARLCPAPVIIGTRFLLDSSLLVLRLLVWRRRAARRPGCSGIRRRLAVSRP